MPTDEEIREAKDFILRRTSAADAAKATTDELVQAAAERLVRIAYKYGVPVSQFQFSSSVNEQMMDEVNEVMDQLEDELLENVEEYALSVTDDVEHRAALLALLLVLGHRGMNMRQTIHAYSWRMLRQAEALIAAYKANGIPVSQAINRIKRDLFNFQNVPEIKDAIRHPQDFAAPYVRNGGKATYPDGSDNVRGVPVEGINALETIADNTVDRMWMQEQLNEMSEEKTCIGYWQDRGSNYKCAHCEEEVGFHYLADINEPYPHINCMCWRVPIYSDGSEGETQSMGKEKGDTAKRRN